jgi:hypothetical protein
VKDLLQQLLCKQYCARLNRLENRLEMKSRQFFLNIADTIDSTNIDSQ